MHRLIAAASAVVAGFMMSLGAAGVASAAGPQVVVVAPGQSIQNAVNQAAPGTIILLGAGVYHQSVQIRTDGISLRGAGDTAGGTVIEPPAQLPGTICNRAFGGTGICVLAAKLNTKTGEVITPVKDVTVAGLSVVGFPGSGVFGYGTSGLTVRNVTARNDGDYGISRFESTGTRFVSDAASGNAEAGFYVGDSPDAATVVHNVRAWDNEFGILIRHARGVVVTDSVLRGNCQGIILVDDGQPGGVGDSRVEHNNVSANNRFCPRTSDVPVALHGGGVLLLGATNTLVAHNSVYGNTGRKINSGGIVVASATSLTGGSTPDNDRIVGNSAHRNKPADLIWDGSGTGNVFSGNHCTKSVPADLCG